MCSFRCFVPECGLKMTRVEGSGFVGEGSGCCIWLRSRFQGFCIVEELVERIWSSRRSALGLNRSIESGYGDFSFYLTKA